MAADNPSYDGLSSDESSEKVEELEFLVTEHKKLITQQEAEIRGLRDAGIENSKLKVQLHELTMLTGALREEVARISANRDAENSAARNFRWAQEERVQRLDAELLDALTTAKQHSAQLQHKDKELQITQAELEKVNRQLNEERLSRDQHGADRETRLLAVIESLNVTVSCLEQEHATAEGKCRQLESKLLDTRELLDRETRVRGFATQNADTARSHADELKGQVDELTQNQMLLEQQIAKIQVLLQDEIQEKCKVAEERLRLEKEVEHAQNHQQQLLASAIRWMAWSGSIKAEMLKLQECQSAMLKAIDPAFAADFAIAGEHAPKDIDDIAQDVGNMIATLVSMTKSAKDRVQRVCRENNEALANINSNLEEAHARARELTLKCNNISKDLAKSEHEAAALKSQLASAEEEVDRMRRDAGASRDDRGRVEEDLKVAREEAAALKSQLASAEEEVDRMRRDAGASRDDRGRVEEDLKVAREEAAALKSQLASAEQSLTQLLGLQKESATVSMELSSLKTRLSVVREEVLHLHHVATSGEEDLVAIRNDWHMSIKEAHALPTQLFTAMVQTDQVTKATGYEALTKSQENMLEDEALDLVRQSFDELIQAKKALEELRERMRTRLSMLQSAAERVVADRVKLTNAMRDMQEELVEQHDLRMEVQWLRGENDRVHRRLARL